MNLSEGASGDFLLTSPYKTKIKLVLFPSPQYPPSCNLALIVTKSLERFLRKSRLFSFFAFVIESLKTFTFFYKGDYSFIIVF